MQWHIHRSIPSGWQDYLKRCGGGFFHSPPGLLAGAPRATAAFAVLTGPEGVFGVAAGVVDRCRLATKARHWYFPTLPAVHCEAGVDEALGALVEKLAKEGGAEVTFDSFDADAKALVGGAAQPGPARLEYRISLLEGAADGLSSLARTHRRHVNRGEREGWVFRKVSGQESLCYLGMVQGGAASRAESRGRPFTPGTLSELADEPGDLPAWGARTYAAFADRELLAAALVGIANGRAFYVMGGSTGGGYRAGAAAWLHWRTMRTLADAGCRSYNLGGTPATATMGSSPFHGLYRFKAGFGGDIVGCQGVSWRLRPRHIRAHTVLAQVRAVAHDLVHFRLGR